MADEVKPPVAIRITRPYLTEDEFLEREFDTLTRTSVILIGAQARPQGVILRFEVVLKSGISVLRGEGRVVGYKPTALTGEPGLTLRFTRLDAKSKALVDRAASLREARIRGSAPPGTRPSAPPPAIGSTGEVPAASPSFLAPSALRGGEQIPDLAAELAPPSPRAAAPAPVRPSSRPPPLSPSSRPPPLSPSSRPPPLPAAYRARATPPPLPATAFVNLPPDPPPVRDLEGAADVDAILESTQVERFAPDPEPVARPRSQPPLPLRVQPVHEPESEPLPHVLQPAHAAAPADEGQNEPTRVDPRRSEPELILPIDVEPMEIAPAREPERVEIARVDLVRAPAAAAAVVPAPSFDAPSLPQPTPARPAISKASPEPSRLGSSESRSRRDMNGAPLGKPAQRDALLDRLRNRARGLEPARVSAILAKRS